MGCVSLWQVVDLHNASFISSFSALRMYVLRMYDSYQQTARQITRDQGPMQ
jgi:hypothetical protein